MRGVWAMLAHHRLADGADDEHSRDQHDAVAEADGEFGNLLLDLVGGFTPRVEVEVVFGGVDLRRIHGVVPHGLSPPLE